MDVSAIAATLLAAILTKREEFRESYRALPNEQAYWGMIDLVGSGLYRSTYGHEEGYMQGETFLHLARLATTPYKRVEVLKELGDAVLLRATDFRDMLEPMLLVDLVAGSISHRSDDPRHAFAVRSGITFGHAKLLKRHGVEDYLGEPIDRLARLMAHRDSGASFIIDAATAEQEGVMTLTDYPGVEVGSRIVIPAAEAKSLSPVHCFPVLVQKELLADYRDFFSVWKRR